MQRRDRRGSDQQKHQGMPQAVLCGLLVHVMMEQGYSADAICTIQSPPSESKQIGGQWSAHYEIKVHGQ